VVSLDLVSEKPGCQDVDIIASWCQFLLLVNVHDRYMLSPVRLLSVCLSSVTLVRLTQTVEILRNISSPFLGHPFSRKILRRSSQGTPPVGGLNAKGLVKYSDFGPIEGVTLWSIALRGATRRLYLGNGAR